MMEASCGLPAECSGLPDEAGSRHGVIKREAGWSWPYSGSGLIYQHTSILTGKYW